MGSHQGGCSGLPIPRLRSCCLHPGKPHDGTFVSGKGGAQVVVPQTTPFVGVLLKQKNKNTPRETEETGTEPWGGGKHSVAARGLVTRSSDSHGPHTPAVEMLRMEGPGQFGGGRRGSSDACHQQCRGRGLPPGRGGRSRSAGLRLPVYWGFPKKQHKRRWIYKYLEVQFKDSVHTSVVAGVSHSGRGSPQFESEGPLRAAWPLLQGNQF